MQLQVFVPYHNSRLIDFDSDAELIFLLGYAVSGTVELEITKYILNY